MENSVYREMQLHPDAFTPMQLEAVMDAIDDAPDVARAWESFADSHRRTAPEKNGVPFRFRGAATSARHHAAADARHPKVTARGWSRKVAAAVIAFVTCGLIYAAAVAGRFLPNLFAPSEKVVDDVRPAAVSEIVADGDNVPVTNEDESILYDNVPLSQILDDVAAYHNLKVIYLNEQTGKTRLFYKWTKRATLEETIRSFNSFERISIVQKDSTVIVQ